jgi:hypothetical protein
LHPFFPSAAFAILDPSPLPFTDDDFEVAPTRESFDFDTGFFKPTR